MVIRYREINGRVVKDVISRTRLRGEERPPGHFSETVLKAYYKLECDEGSRFKSGYSKNEIKRTHDTAIQRFQQTGKEV
jgi:hypothetical protein